MFAPTRKTLNNFDYLIHDKYETKSKIKLNISANQNSINAFVNASSRQKLFEILSVKYSKLCSTKELNDQIDTELLNLFQKDVITEIDLILLDKKLKDIIGYPNKTIRIFNLNNESKINSPGNLPRVLSKSASYLDTKSIKNERLDTKNSRMSGGSSLSVIFDVDQKMKNDYVKTIIEINKQEAEKKPQTLPYNIEDWNSVMRYNKKQFEEEKNLRKINQKQIQEMMKKELNSQLREKINARSANLIEEKDYHEFILKNCCLKENEEKQKEESRKKKLKEEKKITDKLIELQKEHKRMERLKEKQFDKEISIDTF
jgi:hypothetical protein